MLHPNGSKLKSKMVSALKGQPDINGYEKTCDYLDITDNRTHIQQRTLACQSKALSHMLQRELYTMGNSVLIRREAKMTHLQPNLGETIQQQIRSSSFSHSTLFHSQLVKEKEEFLLKKAPLKHSGL